MNKITTAGLDLAKNNFHVVCTNGSGKIVRKRMLKRAQVLPYFAQLPSCLVGIEACSGAHYWHRELAQLGHQVKQLPAQYVKAFVRGNKNDYNDALAIAEAVRQPELRPVSPKTIPQQDIQALIRLRQKAIASRTLLSNQLRGLLAEYGIVLHPGMAVIRRRIPELLEDADNGLSPLFRECLAEGYRQLQDLDGVIERYTRKLTHWSQQHEACQRLQSIPGYGSIVASVYFSQVGNGQDYRRGRDVSASLGLVPAQHSSGGKPRLLGISKRGNGYLRSLLVHGARAVLRQAERQGKTDRLSLWALRLKEKKGHNKAVVALANKMARMGWVILNQHTVYQAR